MTIVVRTRAELAAARSGLSGTVGLVPTMGALHVGHAALIQAAAAACDAVVVSVFVNPMQFTQAADLERYPRPLADDVARREELGVDVVWAPSVEDVYPDGPVKVAVTGGDLAAQLEGGSRPGHFDGVLTVVHKLFSLITPHRAFFGEKDYQQLVLVRRMVFDLDLDVDVVGAPTVREPDGLALSSRNVFLSAEERAAATHLSAALAAARNAGPAPVATLLTAAEAVLARAPEVKLDYLQVRRPDLGPAPASGPARVLVAGWLGATRLIDNIAIEVAR